MKKTLLILSLSSIFTLAASADELQVLESQGLDNGVVEQIVKDAQGRVYKRYLNKPVAIRPAAEEGENTDDAAQRELIYHESFEAYQTEYGLNWIPEDWTKKVAPGNEPKDELVAKNINNSWYCYLTGDGYFTPITTDGTRDAFIHYGYTDSDNGLLPVAQDEWLISPIVILPEDKDIQLDFLLASSWLDLYDNDYFNWSTLKFTERKVVNNFKVMITTDEGETWESVYDLCADYVDKADDDTVYDTELTSFASYTVDLTKYAGKDIQMGFRYLRDEGNWIGNSMVLDGIKVSTADKGGVGKITADKLSVVKSGDELIFNGLVTKAEVYNLAGCKVIDSKVTDGKLNIAELAAGVYVVRTAAGVAKFVK